MTVPCQKLGHVSSWQRMRQPSWFPAISVPALIVDTTILSRQPRSLPDKWEHDYYEGGEVNGGIGGGGSRLSSKLLISNLDYGVSNADIKVYCNYVYFLLCKPTAAYVRLMGSSRCYATIVLFVEGRIVQEKPAKYCSI